MERGENLGESERGRDERDATVKQERNGKRGLNRAHKVRSNLTMTD